jgi:hypothetical protein
MFVVGDDHVAQSDYRCDWCGEAIPAGTRYTRLLFIPRRSSKERHNCAFHMECEEVRANAHKGTHNDWPNTQPPFPDHDRPDPPDA